MKKWQTKVMLLSAGLALATTGIVAQADDTTTTGFEVTGTPLTLRSVAGGTDLNFGSVTLAELSKGPVDLKASLAQDTFTVTNYTGMQQSWTLVAGITSFRPTIGSKPFEGSLSIDGKSMHVSSDASLVGAINLASETMEFNNYTWTSPQFNAVLTVPQTASIGSYNATIHYELQNGIVSPK